MPPFKRFATMKSLFPIRATGFLVLLALIGCGKDQGKQAEMIRDFEESFALDAAPESGWEPSPSSYSDAPAAPSRQTGSAIDPSARETFPAPDSSAGPAGSAPAQEISAATREVAREVVRFMETGKHSLAVERLDQLMATPDLTPNQWIAARNAMAEVQRRIVMDPSISEAEKEKAKQVLQRQ